METLYAIRDAVFWWAGVWATVTLGNHAVSNALKRRQREERAQWRREFVEFLIRADAMPEGPEAEEPEEGEATPEAENGH